MVSRPSALDFGADRDFSELLNFLGFNSDRHVIVDTGNRVERVSGRRNTIMLVNENGKKYAVYSREPMHISRDLSPLDATITFMHPDKPWTKEPSKMFRLVSDEAIFADGDGKTV